MYLIITSLLVWIFALLIGAILFPLAFIIWIISYPFDKRLKALHLFSCFWASVYTWMNPLWKTTITGKEKIDRNNTYVMVCNHQSLLDILVLYRLFVHFKWVSKKELFKFPVMGWNMILNQYIAVDRASKKSHLHMIKQCEKTLQNKNSIMIFPEGTRSSDHQIHAFKDGAFRIAQAAKVDILPIILSGTSDSLPKSGFIMKKSQNIQIKILDPIPYSSFSGLTTKEIADLTYNIMCKEFEVLKKVH